MGAKLKKVEAEKLYKNMLLVRRLEEKFGQLYQMGYMAGFLHLYIGEEAIAAGMNYLKKEQDTHITTYRCHAPVSFPSISAATFLGDIFPCNKA